MIQKNGKVVVFCDDWTLRDAGFSKTPDARTFTQNLANWFSGGRPGKSLVYSTNAGPQSQATTGIFQGEINP